MLSDRQDRRLKALLTTAYNAYTNITKTHMGARILKTARTKNAKSFSTYGQAVGVDNSEYQLTSAKPIGTPETTVAYTELHIL